MQVGQGISAEDENAPLKTNVQIVMLLCLPLCSVPAVVTAPLTAS